MGKSYITIWLPGQLRLTLSRLCLSSPWLTYDRLAQLLSQSAVRHDSVLVQVHEFQGTVGRWMEARTGSGAAGGVTPNGFCECLQGSTSMGRGVVVLTGTKETSAQEARCALPAVFRRVHSMVEIGWMCAEDIRSFFENFLLHFVPDCPLEE